MTNTKICQILDHVSDLLSVIPGALFINDPTRVTNEENGPVIVLEWAEEGGFTRDEVNICNAIEILPIIITIQCPRQIAQPAPMWRIVDPWFQLVHAAMYQDRTLGGLASPRPAGLGAGGVVLRGQQPASLPTVVRLICAYDIGVSTRHNDLTQ